MKKLLAAALFALSFLAVTPAHAVVECHQYLGCREVGAQAPIVTNPKIARHIVSRENVRITHGKTAKILRGLGGTMLSPMTDYVAPLQACGYDVELLSWTDGPQTATVVIGHSMAMFPVLESHARARFVIDGPVWAGDQTTDHPRTANFPTPLHPRIHGAINVPIMSDHITAPQKAKRYILAMLGCSTQPPRTGRRGR